MNNAAIFELLALLSFWQLLAIREGL